MTDPYRLLAPLLFRLDPERAHCLALLVLKAGLAGAGFQGADDPVLGVRLWGLTFPNPVGLAAGFDKNAEVVAPALGLGCGFMEVGGVTPKPQSGNPRPRLFRLVSDRAVINRMGFNNAGLDVVAARLARRRRDTAPVGVNLGKNKESADAPADYAALAAGFAPHADFLVINVSSPNTPGLRALQNIEPLLAIVRATRAARDKAVPATPPPLLLKIAPDLEAADLKDIVALALDEGLDGLVISNTTISRPASLTSEYRTETGGLSGAPLFELSTRVLRTAYALAAGKLVLVGVGGIASGADAYAKIRAGASLVQLYSALVYEGPGLFGRIKRDLVQRLKRDGFASVMDAVGADHRSGK
ncbi:MAG: quinone-dependent dihydroorotate dehydrogenase [Rhodospirillaceae bacterium]